MDKRYIVERTILVTHQVVIYAEDETQAMIAFKRGEGDYNEKPFYDAPEGAKEGIKVFEGSEQ